MTTLYANGDFIRLTATQFATYSAIRFSAADSLSSVALGFTALERLISRQSSGPFRQNWMAGPMLRRAGKGGVALRAVVVANADQHAADLLRSLTWRTGNSSSGQSSCARLVESTGKAVGSAMSCCALAIIPSTDPVRQPSALAVAPCLQQ